MITPQAVSRYMGQKFKKSVFIPTGHTDGYEVRAKDGKVYVAHRNSSWAHDVQASERRLTALNQYTVHLFAKYDVHRRGDYLIVTEKTS